MNIHRILKLCFSSKGNSFWREVKSFGRYGLFQIETDCTILAFYNKKELFSLDEVFQAIEQLRVEKLRDKKIKVILNVK